MNTQIVQVAATATTVQTASEAPPRTFKNLQILTDRELVDYYMCGEEKCMEILLERHKGRIFGFILKRTRDREFANDVFQESFFKAIRCLKSGQYNEQDKFAGWIMRIARNMIIDHGRRHSKFRMISSVRNPEGEREDIFNVIDVGEKIPIKHIEKRHAHREIRKLIKRLPIDQRRILIMREYFDMSFREICKMYRINMNTALGRMRYAIINLRKMAAEEKNLVM